MVDCLSGFRAQIGSVANWRYATFVRRLGEAAAPKGGECGPYPDFASYTLAFALQLRKNHGKASTRVTEGRNHDGFVHDHPFYLICPDELSTVGELLSGYEWRSSNSAQFITVTSLQNS